ncbi:uncharacterized protein LOC124149682 [Haliotis rufescens]|uniref:uncharacterized protein LOC124149682 n=1 Tax=Haliotis rufescens TaxID=6454 RepID=UPI00201F8A9C|nr:uncharacterized protein LOC124149682 [Haliotis rufescens]
MSVSMKEACLPRSYALSTRPWRQAMTFKSTAKELRQLRIAQGTSMTSMALYTFIHMCQTMDSAPLCAVCVLVLMLLIPESHGMSELVCPDVGYLGSPANLTCISPSNTTSRGYTTPQGEVAAICSLSSSSCTPMDNYMASTINQTHSILTIPAVQQTHAGQWKCTTHPWSPLSCKITVVKEPSCLLTCATNSSPSCDGGDRAVHVIGYYCSEPVNMKLVSEGSDIKVTTETVTETKNKTVQIPVSNTTFNLVFTCGTYNKTLPCQATEGSTELDEQGGILNQRTFLVAGILVSGFVFTLIAITTVLMKRRNSQAVPQMQCDDPPDVSAHSPNESDNPPDASMWGAEDCGLGVSDASPTVTDAEQHAPAENMELSTFGEDCDIPLSDSDFDDSNMSSDFDE